jgi:uncharacterized protein YecE (DUF72 family)
MPVMVGTSGWQYDSWRGGLYPPGLAKARWLEHYAGRFVTIEVNNSFYRLPDARAFADWAVRTPDDFVMAVKMSRFLTHVRRLKDPQEPVARFLDRARRLGSKLGPVLLQLPPNLRCDLDALDRTLACFPSTVRVAVEFRHPSWLTEEARDVLVRHRAAWCLADRRGATTPDIRTADWGYVRFHQGRAHPDPCYGRTSLSHWARRIFELWGSGADVYAYFNNDGHACAVRDARQFAAAATRAGLVSTRVPAPREVSLTQRVTASPG